NEYGVQVRMEPLSYQYVRWIESEVDDPRSLDLTSDTKYAQDMRGRPLLLFSGEWNIRWAQDHNKTLVLADFGRS
ncbi:MAG: peptide chain release factor 3, partial [Clostridia bacterium]|nr:peptide chain release factor 3 [Clostridia bacterium]